MPHHAMLEHTEIFLSESVLLLKKFLSWQKELLDPNCHLLFADTGRARLADCFDLTF